MKAFISILILIVLGLINVWLFYAGVYGKFESISILIVMLFIENKYLDYIEEE